MIEGDKYAVRPIENVALKQPQEIASDPVAPVSLVNELADLIESALPPEVLSGGPELRYRVMMTLAHRQQEQDREHLQRRHPARRRSTASLTIEAPPSDPYPRGTHWSR
jgi:hypothetical protein